MTEKQAIKKQFCKFGLEILVVFIISILPINDGSVEEKWKLAINTLRVAMALEIMYIYFFESDSVKTAKIMVNIFASCILYFLAPL